MTAVDDASWLITVFKDSTETRFPLPRALPKFEYRIPSVVTIARVLAAATRYPTPVLGSGNPQRHTHCEAVPCFDSKKISLSVGERFPHTPPPA